MRAFARWASSRPYRIVLLTIIGLQILAPVAAATIILDALRRGTAAAGVSALLALAAMGMIGVLVGAGPTEALGISAPILLAGLVAGAALGRYRDLSLAFQATVVVSIVGVALAFALVPAAGQLGDFLRSEMLALLEAGGLEAAQLDGLAAIEAAEFAQVFVFWVFTGVLAALMLGLWWYALASEGLSFGAEFRQLRLGRSLGFALMALVVANILLPNDVIRIVAYMSVAGFLFQGLAVLHARSHSDNWHRAVLVLVYVLLFSPLTGIATMGLSAVGLLDNFFALRRRAEAQD